MFLAADNVSLTLTSMKVTEVFSFIKGSSSAASSFRSEAPFLKQKMVIEPSFVNYDYTWQPRKGAMTGGCMRKLVKDSLQSN